MLCKFRRLLDYLYLTAGGLSAVCMFLLLLVIVSQMVSRAMGINIRGATDYAGYLMAAASFLAFAYTLNRGGHVRVSLFLGRLTGMNRYIAELICHILGSVMSGLLAWHSVNMVYWSYLLGDVSQGQDATKLWIVQTPVAVGSVILAICFFDNLASMLLRRRDNIISDVVE